MPTAIKKPVAKKVAVKPAVARKPAARRPVAKAPAKVAMKPVAKAVAKTAKPVVAGKAKKAAKPAAEKPKKIKLVRDSFSMPEGEYAALGMVKKVCLKAGVEIKKSELLRIGVALVRKLDLIALKHELSALAPLKAGRPKKDK